MKTNIDDKQTINFLSFNGLPNLLPGETFYSWCARYHHLSPYQLKQTNKILFGKALSRLHHDVPADLDFFIEKTAGFFNSGEDILKNHSVFNFYARFLPNKNSDAILSLLLDGKYDQSYTKLVPKKNSLSIHYQLKRCHACTSEDIKQHNYSFWKVFHQLPSTFYCPIHKSPLQILSLPHNRGMVNDLYLANTVDLELAYSVHDKDELKFRKISDFGYTIWENQSLELSDDVLRWCYLYRAASSGYLSFDGSVRTIEIRNHFVEYYGDALEYFGKLFLGDLYDVNCGFIASLFRNAPCRRHPLKHILFICFFFETFNDFLSLYNVVLSDLRLGEQVCEEKIRENQKKLIHLVYQEGISLNQSSTMIDSSVTSLARFLDKKEIPRNKRPRIVGTPTESKLIEMLKTGESRKFIASELNLRKSFIKDYLSLNQSLKTQWESENHAKQIQLHRNQLLNALKNHPNLPIKAIRRLPKNGFQWLYRHDFQWLTETLPAIWKRS